MTKILRNKRNLLLISCVTLLILLLLVWIFFNKLIPFRLSEDMAINVNNIKRAEVNPFHSIFISIRRYSSDSGKSLSNMDGNNLAGFRCSDNLIRTNQGIYILRNVKTGWNDKKRIKNQEFVEFMRNKEKSLTAGRKILTARICQLQNKTILLFYSAGSYDIINADGSSIYQTIYNSKNNEAYLQILPWGSILGSRTYKIFQTPGHVTCDEPFQVTLQKKLYLLCDEELEKNSNHFIYTVDLNKGTQEEFAKCMNDFRDKLITMCN